MVRRASIRPTRPAVRAVLALTVALALSGAAAQAVQAAPAQTRATSQVAVAQSTNDLTWGG